MPDPATPLEALAGSGFSRVADAAQSGGNAITLLCDGPEAFPAWLAAIDAARDVVHLENYVIEDDAIGRSFADALIRASGRRVRCRVLYDWLGCRRRAPQQFWARLRASGIEVRAYNPPSAAHPLSWISRDHRKVLVVDGAVAFTGGLCIGHDWMGDPAQGIAPWRDTAIAIRGPAVADIAAAFADSWAAAGPALPPEPPPSPPPVAGSLTAWVIAGKPDSMGLYRLEQLVAEIAERSLWLTDAYFVATTAYVHALRDAAMAGVDVRLLTPGSSNIGAVRALSVAGYRPLLEAGVRVFEWNGPMLHAKTAVADGCWSRVGSSNSNLASWVSNRELDVTIHDRDFARQMEAMFQRDLENATEIVLDNGHVRPARPTPGAADRPRHRAASSGRLLAGSVAIGSAVGASLSRHRATGWNESRLLLIGGGLLIALALIAFLAPWVLAYPLGAIAAWLGLVLVGRALRLGAFDRADPGAP
jgi:cardiolipin synthase